MREIRLYPYPNLFELSDGRFWLGILTSALVKEHTKQERTTMSELTIEGEYTTADVKTDEVDDTFVYVTMEGMTESLTPDQARYMAQELNDAADDVENNDD